MSPFSALLPGVPLPLFFALLRFFGPEVGVAPILPLLPLITLYSKKYNTTHITTVFWGKTGEPGELGSWPTGPLAYRTQTYTGLY